MSGERRVKMRKWEEGEVNVESNDNLAAPKRVVMLQLCLLNGRFFSSFRD
jgi:hypothetical protein